MVQRAMIDAKKSFTKLKICQYKDDINEKSYEENIKWIKEIKRACNSDRFKPHFSTNNRQ